MSVVSRFDERHHCLVPCLWSQNILGPDYRILRSDKIKTVQKHSVSLSGDCKRISMWDLGCDPSALRINGGGGIPDSSTLSKVIEYGLRRSQPPVLLTHVHSDYLQLHRVVVSCWSGWANQSGGSTLRK